MSAILFGIIFAVCGIASVIVLPYVVLDFLSLPDRKVSSTDWAAWAQAVGTILGVTVAAGIAVYQQEMNKRDPEEQRERKNFAARAILPTALSELMDYINECLDFLVANRDKFDFQDSAYPKLRFPKLPVGLIPSIKDCIEFADEAPRRRLAELLEQLQIQKTRLALINLQTPRINMITTKDTFNSNIVDALDLYARAELLFPYARRVNNNDPGGPTRENIISAANIAHLVDDEGVWEIINRRKYK